MRPSRGSRSTPTGTSHGCWPRVQLGKWRSAAWRTGFLQLLIPICGEAVGGGGIDRWDLDMAPLSLEGKTLNFFSFCSTLPRYAVLLERSEHPESARSPPGPEENNPSCEEVSPAAAEEHYG